MENKYLGKYECSAPYILCCSDAQSFSMAEILELAQEEERTLWDTLNLGYDQVSGLPLLRQTVAKELYHGLTEENILMFSGAQGGIFCALKVLMSSGDHGISITS